MVYHPLSSKDQSPGVLAGHNLPCNEVGSQAALGVRPPAFGEELLTSSFEDLDRSQI